MYTCRLLEVRKKSPEQTEYGTKIKRGQEFWFSFAKGIEQRVVGRSVQRLGRIHRIQLLKSS